MWAKENITEEIQTKLLLDTDSEGETVWHLTAKRRNLDIRQKICELAKEYLTTEEIKN